MTIHGLHPRFALDAASTRCVLIAIATCTYGSAGAKINRSTIIDRVVHRGGLTEAQVDAIIGDVHLAGMVTLSADGGSVGLGEAGRAWLRSSGGH